MSLPSLFPSPPRKSFSSHAIRFERISPINFISQFMQRPRHGSVYKWKRGRWTREEYGSTWLFRARSDRSSPHFPTNSAPATKGKGKRRGGPLEVAAERILQDGRRIDIIFTGKSVPLSTWFLPRFGCPLVTSNDRGRGKGSVKFS